MFKTILLQINFWKFKKKKIWLKKKMKNYSKLYNEILKYRFLFKKIKIKDLKYEKSNWNEWIFWLLVFTIASFLGAIFTKSNSPNSLCCTTAAISYVAKSFSYHLVGWQFADRESLSTLVIHYRRFTNATNQQNICCLQKLLS